jgi:uncharacterized protein YigE (DUF2233 family)
LALMLTNLAVRSILAGFILAMTLAATAAATPPSMDTLHRAANGLWTCSVDPAQRSLRVFYTDQHGRLFRHMSAVVDWLAEDGEQIDCATNGGIYDPTLRPLGWLVADGVLLRAINLDAESAGNFYLQPNGALVISGGQARIASTNELAALAQGDVSHIEFALQSGPLLLRQGLISARLDPASVSRYTRDAVCVSAAGTVIIAYSDRLVSLYEFAAKLKEIGCSDALYLDGHVAQMFPLDAQLEPAQRRDLSVFIGIISRTKHE